jgi:hypothetical protein
VDAQGDVSDGLVGFDPVGADLFGEGLYRLLRQERQSQDQQGGYFGMHVILQVDSLSQRLTPWDWKIKNFQNELLALMDDMVYIRS